MNVRILKTVPGLVNGRSAVIGETLELPTGLALSLVRDGYASAIGTAPAANRETASATTPAKRGPGRPRKNPGV